MSSRKLSDLYKVVRKKIMSGQEYAISQGVKVGKSCRIYTKKFGSEPFLIAIGDHVTVTAGVQFITHDGATWLVADDDGNRFFKYQPINVGNNVFIGLNSIIMPGVTIGDNSIVAAGSIVTKNVATGTIVAGNPARVIGSFDSYRRKVLEKYVNHKDLEGISDYKERVNAAVKLHATRNSKNNIN